MSLKEKEIQKALMEHLYPLGYKIMSTNIHTSGLGECDLLIISEGGVIHEMEIKVSLKDFRADFKKSKHANMEEVWRTKIGHTDHPQRKIGNKVKPAFTWYKCANKFSFVCPKDLIHPGQVPEYCGLWYVDGDRVCKVKDPKFIHRKFASPRLIYQIARNLTAKFVFGCYFMNYQRKKSL